MCIILLNLSFFCKNSLLIIFFPHFCIYLHVSLIWIYRTSFSIICSFYVNDWAFFFLIFLDIFLKRPPKHFWGQVFQPSDSGHSFMVVVAVPNLPSLFFLLLLLFLFARYLASSQRGKLLSRVGCHICHPGGNARAR